MIRWIQGLGKIQSRLQTPLHSSGVCLRDSWKRMCWVIERLRLTRTWIEKGGARCMWRWSTFFATLDEAALGNIFKLFVVPVLGKLTDGIYELRADWANKLSESVWVVLLTSSLCCMSSHKKALWQTQSRRHVYLTRRSWFSQAWCWRRGQSRLRFGRRCDWHHVKSWTFLRRSCRAALFQIEEWAY